MNKSRIIITLSLLIINIVGLLALYSSLHQAGELKDAMVFYRQIAWITIGWAILFLFSFIDYRFYFDLSYILYGLNLFLLLGVKFFGREIMGAKRWISLFGVNFQPSEFSKLAIIIVLSRIFHRQRAGENVLLKRVLLPLSLTLITFILISKQPDLGTGVICLGLFFLMGLSSGIKKRYFLVPLLIGFLLSPVAWSKLKDYQKKRLMVFLNASSEPLGAGYTVIQSKIAIGSGRIFGKGFLSGTQNQFNFLPERHTDFIFTVVAEEWGFLGGTFLFALYYLILYHILAIARQVRDRDRFGYFLCLGVASLYFMHIFVNVGMTMGMLPVVGLPLIFLSYGGTHLFINYLLMGIVFNVSK